MRRRRDADMPERNLPVEHGDHANTIKVDGINWNIEETTLDSAVMNDHTTGTQTIAVRMVLSRNARPTQQTE